ncbi:helix-turn-helix domain-containing protein [Streptacidiphilus jiangxiensis]|uniref:Sugar-specific transcriptional regulator TrmB n=1 Tax=Streptacidiphilus jiangxiensis TaxID=235985 RepID=A0A1H7X6Y7_STRJI|nr:helix-turn-helix domain-containing protein [Streptacidiphilus jiangxiensis]SEM29463.1 Sugar-specific transcriptional regulator TrmB [Streptacidiphilus jiangxiensis]
MLESADEHVRMLSRFGLGLEAEKVYLALVTRTAARTEALAEQTNLALPRVQAAVTTLATAGLVQPFDDGAYRARTPEYAFRDLLDRRQRELDDDRAHVERLAEVFRRSAAARDTSEIVQVITGRAAVAAATCDLQESAQYEVRSMVKPPVLAQPAGDNVEVQTSRMSKGICYRTVYEQSMLSEASEVRLLETSLRCGELVRTTSHVPVKLMMADASQAIVPLDRNTPEPSAVLVRHRSLIDVLEALFERVWVSSTPLAPWQDATTPRTSEAGPQEMSGDAPSAEDVRLLSLMVAGLTDQALSVHLEISTRTVERRIRRLMDDAAVTTRIQLALHAARRGWI